MRDVSLPRKHAHFSVLLLHDVELLELSAGADALEGLLEISQRVHFSNYQVNNIEKKIRK